MVDGFVCGKPFSFPTISLGIWHFFWNCSYLKLTFELNAIITIMKYILLALVVAFTISANSQTATTYYKSGWDKLYLDDNERGAIVDFTKAIELDPKYVLAYLARGDAKSFLLDYRGAISDYSKTIELDSKQPTAYYGRGKAIYIRNSGKEIEDFEEVLDDMDKAILLDPKYVQAYLWRGKTKYELSDTLGAIKDHNKTIQLNPKDIEVYYYYRAVMNEKLKNYKGVVADCTKAIELKYKYSALCFAMRGTAKVNVQDKKGACADFTKAVELGDASAPGLIKKFCE